MAKMALSLLNPLGFFMNLNSDLLGVVLNECSLKSFVRVIMCNFKGRNKRYQARND